MTGAAPPDSAGPSAGPTVVVVGGGIAGLSAAWELTTAAPETRVVVLEAGPRLGGKIHTGSIGGHPVDLGPDAFLARRPEAVALCRELGLEDELVSPASRVAYVWARGRLRALPAGLALGVPTRLGPLARSGIVSPLGVGRAALDLLGRAPTPDTGTRGHGDKTVADITRRHLGREVTAHLVDPLVGGIHAGDTARMSAAAVFPALLDAHARGGSLMRALRAGTAKPTTAAGEPPVFHSVRGGLSRLVDTLAGALATRGVEVHSHAPVDRLELHRAGDGAGPDPRRASSWSVHGAHGIVEADAVIIATPARTTAALLDPVDHALAAAVGAIEYADVTVVTMEMPEGSVGRTLDGTGFLVPVDSGHLITACTWLDSKWPELRRHGSVLLRASMGRFGDNRAACMSDDEIVRRVLDDLGPMLGVRARPTEVVVTRWPGAFPQYALGHTERVRSIEDAVARVPALALAGAAYHGVGIPACIASGRAAAQRALGPHVATDLSTR